MIIFPQDRDVVLYETEFEDDSLERGKLSKQLSDFVERIEDPIVIALDDKWGSGKTYFLKRWVTAHKNQNNGKAITVYFDAFENDYLSDPFVSIIAAVGERIPKKQELTLNKLKTAATKLAKPAFGIALSLATFGAKQQLDEIGDVIAEAVSSEAKDAAQDLWVAEKDRKAAIDSFKELLSQLTEDEKVPIVIVVDELDRCRPDYALSVLEVIKHFFAVPRVHFILGVNGTALENSVKARYGADIDAENYLRKFINVSFSLPRTLGPRGGETVIARYAAKLISDMKLPEIPSKSCAELISYVAAANEVSLRDVGKILSRVALLPEEVFEGKYLPGWIETLCILLVSAVVNPKFHKKLVSASASIDETREFLGASENKTAETIDGNRNPDYDHDLALWLVTTLFTCGSDSPLENDDLPEWRDKIGQRFDRFGLDRDPKKIPATIQRDWVDIFRIQ